ncbi:MAG: glycosyltransferase family 39 protein [Chloroflexota bacterium]|nr:glycosyltransferase family 39 protein [Chloroflexota bacterium]
MAEVSNQLQHEDKDVSSNPIQEQVATERASGTWARRRPGIDWLLAGIIGIVALGLNLYRIGAPSLWFDEILSVERARQSLPVLWKIVTTTQPNMALYYFFLHGWLNFTALFGLHATEAVVRFPSAIFAAMASIVVFLLGRRFLGRVGGLTAAGLYVLNDLQLVYAQETRSYAMQLVLLCLAWYALLIVLTTGRHQKRWLVCYVLAMTLSVYVHFFSLLLLFAQALALGALLLLPTPWRERTRQRLRPLIVSLLSIGILVTPMLIASRVGSKTDWIPIPNLKDVIHLFLTIGDDSPIYVFFLAVFIALGLAVTMLTFRSEGRRLLQRASFIRGGDDTQITHYQQFLPLALMLLCWLVVPIVASYVISQKSTHLFLSRYLVTVVPALFLLVGIGLVVIRWRIVKVVLVFCLLLFAMRYVPTYYASAQVEEWNTASHWLEQHYQSGDGMVCYNTVQGCQVGIEYYFYAYPTPSKAHFDADSPGSFPWVGYDTTNIPGDSDKALDHNALQTYASKHSRVFFIVARLGNDDQVTKAGATVAWLNTRYHQVDHIVTPTVTVHLYNIESARRGWIIQQQGDS